MCCMRAIAGYVKLQLSAGLVTAETAMLGPYTDARSARPSCIRIELSTTPFERTLVSDCGQTCERDGAAVMLQLPRPLEMKSP